jgi:hypothetical protein
MLIRSSLFWDITRRRVVIVYRRFGITYRPHLQGSRVEDSWPLKMGPIRCPETGTITTRRRVMSQKSADLKDTLSLPSVRPTSGTIRIVKIIIHDKLQRSYWFLCLFHVGVAATYNGRTSCIAVWTYYSYWKWGVRVRWVAYVACMGGKTNLNMVLKKRDHLEYLGIDRRVIRRY